MVRLLQHYIIASTMLDVDISTYAETFYEQLQSRTSGDVFLSDTTVTELAKYVRYNVEQHCI